MMNSFFTNKNRLLKILILIVLILILNIYGVTAGSKHEVIFPEMLKNPQAFDEKIVPFGGKVEKIQNNLATINDRGIKVQLKGQIPARKGQTISGIGVFHAEEKVLVVQQFRIQHLRWIKVGLSLFVFLALVTWLIYDYNFDWKNFLFLKKR